MKALKNSVLALTILGSCTLGVALAQPAASASTPAAASAAPTDKAGRAPHDRMHARMEKRMNQHLATLKSKLKLSADQEAAWTTYANAMQPPAKGQPPFSREDFAKLSTPERLDKMREFRQKHIAAMDQRDDATRTFYSTLTPEQKKTFDQQVRMPMHDMMKERGSKRGPGSASPTPAAKP